jgi:hypothetical protein
MVTPDDSNVLQMACIFFIFIVWNRFSLLQSMATSFIP